MTDRLLFGRIGKSACLWAGIQLEQPPSARISRAANGRPRNGGSHRALLNLPQEYVSSSPTAFNLTLVTQSSGSTVLASVISICSG